MWHILSWSKSHWESIARNLGSAEGNGKTLTDFSGDQDLFQRVQCKHSFYQLQIWLHYLTLVLCLVLFKLLKEVVKQSPQALEPMKLLSPCDKVVTCAHRTWFLYRNTLHEGSYWFLLFISLLCSTAVIHIKAYFLTSNIFKSKNPS